MYECESWTIKKVKRRRMDAFWLWCWRRPAAVNLKGNQSWITIRRTDAEAEAPILWPPDVKSHLIGKEEKRTIEDKMVGWCHQLRGHEFEQTLGESEGQGRLVCALCGCKESDTTEWLNNNMEPRLFLQLLVLLAKDWSQLTMLTLVGQRELTATSAKTTQCWSYCCWEGRTHLKLLLLWKSKTLQNSTALSASPSGQSKGKGTM